MTELANFELEGNLFIHWFRLWKDAEFYMTWLIAQGDQDVQLSSWEPGAGGALVRDVTFDHPVREHSTYVQLNDYLEFTTSFSF